MEDHQFCKLIASEICQDRNLECMIQNTLKCTDILKQKTGETDEMSLPVQSEEVIIERQIHDPTSIDTKLDTKLDTNKDVINDIEYKPKLNTVINEPLNTHQSSHIELVKMTVDTRVPQSHDMETKCMEYLNGRVAPFPSHTLNL